MLERCSHSATYTCGLNCQFCHRRFRPWAGSGSHDHIPPSRSLGLSSAGAGSKRPREELAVELPSKRRESGHLTSFEGRFRPFIALDDQSAYGSIPRANSCGVRTVNPTPTSEEAESVIEANVKESRVSEVRVSQFLDTGNTTCGSGDHFSTSSGFEDVFSERLSAPFRAFSHRFLSRAGKRKHRSFADIWRSRRIPPMSIPDTTVRPLSPVPVASPAETQGKDVVIQDTIELPRVPKKRVETMVVEERKRFFIDTPTLPMIIAMRKWVADTYALLGVHREEDKCWLHPSPPPPKSNGRARGVISRGFFWADDTGRHCIQVNFGVVALIINHYLTDEQMEGYITKGWHLSHLCGNWTCCNWKHFTVEAGSINIRRNVCFRLPRGCHHSPKCMKDKKRRLLPVAPTLSTDKTLGRVQEILIALSGNSDSDG